jgi:hypothetical protein
MVSVLCQMKWWEHSSGKGTKHRFLGTLATNGRYSDLSETRLYAESDLGLISSTQLNQLVDIRYDGNKIEPILITQSKG